MDPARDVGGDFYDYFFVDDDHLCLVMADVSDKGVPASLFMMVSKTIVKNCAELGLSPAKVLEKTNETLCESNSGEMFVTVWIGILEISTGILTAANAGHEFPFFKQNGRFSLYKDKHGFVVGGYPSSIYSEYQVEMKPGDMLFVYTDGVPEACTVEGELFGVERLEKALNDNPSNNCEEVVYSMYETLASFVKSAQQFDDLTMLCMQYRGKDNN